MTGKKFTTVDVDHENDKVVAVTTNGDGQIVNVEKAHIPRSAKDPDMTTDDQSGFIFDA